MVKLCRHCQEVNKNPEDEFCCSGCEIAFNIINKLGFSNYYKQRITDSSIRKIKPDEDDAIDISEFITTSNNLNSVSLIIQGLHCAACVWLIENILKKQENVSKARINLSKKTLFLEFSGDKKSGNELISLIQKIGYKLLPFDSEIIAKAEKKYDDSILKSLAIAAFGAGNIMLFSIVLWFYNIDEIGEKTRNLLQFFSSFIALPVIIFSSRPFFSSAFKSLKSGFPNMDLAISIAIFLASIVSLLETFRSGSHIYFDSAVMLIFFLLIGRYLDLKARKKAFKITTEFSLFSASFGRVLEDGNIRILPAKNLIKDMILIIAAGEKIAADGIIIEGESEVDFSIISGESIPKKVRIGSEVYNGTINLGTSIKVKITKTPENSLLAQIISLSEQIENKKNFYIRIADRLAKFYLPTVHILAALTFIFWFKEGWEIALMNATAVLIITCPCALALAVPIVQTILISNFIRKGILIKSGEALEKLSKIDSVIFDKTGSVTIGSPKLVDVFLLQNNQLVSIEDERKKFYFKIAASLSQKSRHPLSKAISENFQEDLFEIKAKENHGFGLEGEFENQLIKLGKKEFCQIQNSFKAKENFLQTFLKIGNDELVFLFEDELKSDAESVIAELKKISKKIILLSGDNEVNVKKVAQKLGISEFYFEQTPVDKVNFLQELKSKNQILMMIGDGINDAPALALSDVSISFSKASDISQNIADIVIQGEKLMPIIEVIKFSRKAIQLMKENLLIALIYNLIAVPFAMSGQVMPMIAAIAMSSSSLIVLFNSLRINSQKCLS
jgi:P-type Cu2+ transporter